tara:strand:- start:1461 stop:1988 length:528 start_codon:yes stop_codon:yes gene_type:complete
MNYIERIENIITKLNNINNTENTENIPIIKDIKPQKKEKDLIKALKLSKAVYDVRNNKEGNFNKINNKIIEEKTYTLDNITEKEINPVWNKIDKSCKEELLQECINKEKEKYNLSMNEEIILYELLINNIKYIEYDRNKKYIIGFYNLIYRYENKQHIYLINDIKIKKKKLLYIF